MSRASEVADVLRAIGPGTVVDLIRERPEWTRNQVEDAIRRGNKLGLILCRFRGGGRWRPSVWEAAPQPMPVVSVFQQEPRQWLGPWPPLQEGRRFGPLGGWD